MQVSLGPVVDGVAPPMPDVWDGETLLEGCLNRFASVPPKADRALLSEFMQFVQSYVTRKYDPLQAGLDISCSTWLANNHTYSLGRKHELQSLWDEAGRSISEVDYAVKLFGKVETYMAYKQARGINSRSDKFKCYSGPLFHLMEEVVYQDEAFIKHIPVRCRPEYIMKMLGGDCGPFYETDYTAFERHFLPHILEACEFILYSHMLKFYPTEWSVIKDAMGGINSCRSRRFMLKVFGRRMSGEMCTSLGNGFSNLMLFKFACFKSGGECRGVVEGDDGLFASTVPVDSSIFERLGFTIKMKVHVNLLESSFCGIVMSRDLCTMTDPHKVLANFGWTHSQLMTGGEKVLMGLLRAKALSLRYEHPRCPVISVLASRFVELTEGFQERFDSNWYEGHLRREVVKFSSETIVDVAAGVSDVTRHDFERVYGISFQDQLQLEEYFRNVPLGVRLSHPALQRLFSKHQPLRQYWDRYVRPRWLKF